MPTAQDHDAALSVRIPKVMMSDLLTMADGDDRPLSRLVREALGAYIRQRKSKTGAKVKR